MQRRSGGLEEFKDSPSKSAKIVMRYISNIPDVGPQTKQQPVTYDQLVEISSNLDKGLVWLRNDLRLIFGAQTSQEALNKIKKIEEILELK